MKGVLLTFFGRGLQLIAAFLTIRISTGLMSPVDVGALNQLNSISVLLASAFIAPVIAYFARGVYGWISLGEFRVKFLTMLVVILALALVLAALAYSAQVLLRPVVGMSAGWVGLLILLYLAAFPVHVLLVSCLSILGQRGRTVAYSNLGIWLGLGLAVALYAYSPKTEVWLLGIYCGYAIALPLALNLARHGQTASPGKGDQGDPLPFSWKPVFHFIWPQIIVYALWWIQSQSYRFVLADLAGLASVGLFFAGYALCSVPMQAFEAAFNEYYAPTFYRGISGAGREALADAWNRYARAYMPSVVLFGSYLAACAPFFCVLALGKEFQVVSAFVLWPALIETARALSSSMHTLGLAKVDMRNTLPAVITGALAAPPLIIMLAPADPLNGTGLALLLAGIAVLAIVVVVTRISLPVKWPVGRLMGAALAGLPMVVLGRWIFNMFPESILAALAAMTVLGGYLLGALYLFSRDWLAESAALNSPGEIPEDRGRHGAAAGK